MKVPLKHNHPSLSTTPKASHSLENKIKYDHFNYFQVAKYS